MINRSLFAGTLFIAPSIFFMISSGVYGIGSLSNPGPGLFPFIVSLILFSVGVMRCFTVTNTDKNFNFIKVAIGSLWIVLITSFLLFIVR